MTSLNLYNIISGSYSFYPWFYTQSFVRRFRCNAETVSVTFIITRLLSQILTLHLLKGRERRSNKPFCWFFQNNYFALCSFFFFFFAFLWQRNTMFSIKYLLNSYKIIWKYHLESKLLQCETSIETTIIHKIFETNSSFHVK